MRAPTIYVGDHQHAKVVCSAFAEGCGGRLVPATSRLRPGPAAMWGILRGAGDRIKECEMYGHPYFYIDHGYFSRGHYDGYYRVVFCDRHLPDDRISPTTGERWRAMALSTFARVHGGDTILYLPISRHVAAYLGMDAGAFDAEQIDALRARYDGAKVAVKEKAEGALAEHLDGVFMVVGFQTNALFEAHRLGYLTKELGRSPAALFNPATAGRAPFISRERIFGYLADNQWTLAEMRSGKCWSDLMERYGDALHDALAA